MLRRSAVAVMLVALAACARQPATPVGLWDATVVVNGVEVPFQFDIAGTPDKLTGAFLNGALREESKSGRFDGGNITLNFDQYGARLDAVLKDGQLTGKWDRGTRGVGYVFHAAPAAPAATRAAVSGVPDISGIWIMPTTSSKGEKAFRFIVRQTGAELDATILRVDGDSGTLSGAYRDGRFVLGHFAGAGPTRVEVTPETDGTLTVLEDGKTRYTAVREAAAKAAALPEPSDPEDFTRAKNPKEPLAFSFPDLDGQLLSLADARFTDKVVIVSITGSWCPNCHDEAPFLVDLYKKYRGLGLEIVAVAFEEPAQLKNPQRVRAFAQHFGINYPIVLAGEPSELAAKFPQFESLNAFPTSFYLGRDGRVRLVHTGFPSPASGPFYQEARDDIERQVERLLAEK